MLTEKLRKYSDLTSAELDDYSTTLWYTLSDRDVTLRKAEYKSKSHSTYVPTVNDYTDYVIILQSLRLLCDVFLSGDCCYNPSLCLTSFMHYSWDWPEHTHTSIYKSQASGATKRFSLGWLFVPLITGRCCMLQMDTKPRYRMVDLSRYYYSLWDGCCSFR